MFALHTCLHAGFHAILLTDRIAGSYTLLLHVAAMNKRLAEVQFLVIWRFFRMWALADGVQVPENMMRCICNNYDIEVSRLQSRTNVHPFATLHVLKSCHMSIRLTWPYLDYVLLSVNQTDLRLGGACVQADPPCAPSQQCSMFAAPNRPAC